MMEYNYIPGHIFLSKNTRKYHELQKYDKIYQLVVTNILMGGNQCIYVVNLKCF